MSIYWNIAMEIIVGDLGIELSSSVLAQLTESVELSASMESEACGYLDIPNPLVKENEELLDELIKEKSKSSCKVCRGSGRIISAASAYGRSSINQCYHCDGEGRTVDGLLNE